MPTTSGLYFVPVFSWKNEDALRLRRLRHSIVCRRYQHDFVHDKLATCWQHTLSSESLRNDGGCTFCTGHQWQLKYRTHCSSCSRTWGATPTSLQAVFPVPWRPAAGQAVFTPLRHGVRSVLRDISVRNCIAGNYCEGSGGQCIYVWGGSTFQRRQ